MMNTLSTAALLAGKFGEAAARIVSHDMTIVDLIGCAEAMESEILLAHELYELWIRYNPNAPLLYAAHFNNAVLSTRMNDITKAIASLQESIRLQPEFLPPYINLGTALERLGDRASAIRHWMAVVDRLSAVSSDAIGHRTAALKQIGRVFEEARDVVQAEATLRRSIEIDPQQPDVTQHLISLRQTQCKWPVIEPIGRLDVASQLRMISPLSLAAYTDDPLFQLSNANRYHRRDRAQIELPVTVGQWVAPEGATKRPLRIGYISPDLREHAVGFLTAGIFPLHDRKDFEVYAYYTGPNLPDPHQARVQKTVDHWVDLTPFSDKQAALAILRDEIDILVDLGGYTKDSRNKLFALRPAPIIVNWLGYPGTMGSADHHYIIADSVIIPADYERFYSERVLRLPCYQPNDRNRVVAMPPTRSAAGLPEDAFVYCCFNGSQKFSQFTFERWMQILQRAPNSVLWLLSGGDPVDAHLRDLATSRGVLPERLIFAPRQRNPEHMARYKLADLFLDTSPYGAHTTASDAMWMGVPVVTLVGRAFASRVCASLVTAAGLPDLIARSSEEYIALAVALGTSPTRLAEIRSRLDDGRDTCALFDTSSLVKRLESLYTEIWQDFMAGNLPRPDLKNLDVFGDIAAHSDHESVECLDDDVYHKRYATAIVYQKAIADCGDTNRLWPDLP